MIRDVGILSPNRQTAGDPAWKNARKAAEKSIPDYAAQLHREQAERQHESGFAHPPDTKWMWKFEHSFHFSATADQHRAIDETKLDLEQPRPMDRLIGCGKALAAQSTPIKPGLREKITHSPKPAA